MHYPVQLMSSTILLFGGNTEPWFISKAYKNRNRKTPSAATSQITAMVSLIVATWFDASDFIVYLFHG